MIGVKIAADRGSSKYPGDRVLGSVQADLYRGEHGYDE